MVNVHITIKTYCKFHASKLTPHFIIFFELRVVVLLSSETPGSEIALVTSWFLSVQQWMWTTCTSKNCRSFQKIKLLEMQSKLIFYDIPERLNENVSVDLFLQENVTFLMHKKIESYANLKKQENKMHSFFNRVNSGTLGHFLPSRWVGKWPNYPELTISFDSECVQTNKLCI